MSMIDVSNLTFGYEGSPELIFDHVGFQIDSGWKLGFTGRNGRGKTTFLRLLQGEYPYSGTISASVEFEYFPYEVANLSRTGLEVVREIAPEAEDWERDHWSCPFPASPTGSGPRCCWRPCF